MLASKPLLWSATAHTLVFAIAFLLPAPPRDRPPKPPITVTLVRMPLPSKALLKPEKPLKVEPAPEIPETPKIPEKPAPQPPAKPTPPKPAPPSPLKTVPPPPATPAMPSLPKKPVPGKEKKPIKPEDKPPVKAQPVPEARPKVKPKPMAQPVPRKKTVPKKPPKRVKPPVITRETPQKPPDFSKEIAKLQTKETAKVPGGKNNASVPAQKKTEPRASRLAVTLWQQKIDNRVRDNWNKPSGLLHEGGLEVAVLVQVAVDGRLQNPRISQSSGNRVFDTSVLRAILKTASVDPPPQGCRECQELEFVFRPEQ